MVAVLLLRLILLMLRLLLMLQLRWPMSYVGLRGSQRVYDTISLLMLLLLLLQARWATMTSVIALRVPVYVRCRLVQALTKAV